jgi:amino acid transporter
VTTKPSTRAEAADDFCEDCGYEPELKRSLGTFQVFAVSFAFISVAVGVFGTYDDVLQNAGPVGIWLWPVVAVGQMLIALVIAQFAARIPLTGSPYQWASRLANPKIGWWFGWVMFCYLVTAVVAADNAMATTAFMPLFGMQPNGTVARAITVAMVVVQAVLAIYSIRIVAWINSAAVIVEVLLVAVLVCALLIAASVTNEGSVANLASRGIVENSPGYFAVGGGLTIAMLAGLGTLVGFDSAANLAEEAKDPFRSVPRAIVGSVTAAGVLGMLFLIALTVAIGNVAKVSASGSPVADIMRDQLGPVTEKVLLVGITFAFFGAGMVTLTTCSRIVYAMARDARFPSHRMMARVSPRTQTPVPATILILAVGALLTAVVPGNALLDLITASTIFPAILYGLMTILYLSVRKRLDRAEGAFDLGRFEMPVAIAALVWTLIALFALVSPTQARVPVLVVIGLLLAGGAYFAYLFISKRDVLETEPGHLTVFEH